MKQLSNNYDLEERTAKFGENVIKFCKTIRETAITKSLINQLVRSGTSIGANYMEANAASSRKDFQNKIFICKKDNHHFRRGKTISLQILWGFLYEFLDSRIF